MHQAVRAACLWLTEAYESVAPPVMLRQFGAPVWQAGRRTYAGARWSGGRLDLNFWVGVLQQGLLVSDARYRIPPYLGHNGWISLDVTAGCDPEEVAALALDSYRHFALKRMLVELPHEVSRARP